MTQYDQVYVIAEAGVNHNGDPHMAHDLVDAAANAGADAVKFQTFSAEKLVSQTHQKADYQKASTGADQTQYEMLRAIELSHDMHYELLAHATRRGIDFMSTAFDIDSLRFLTELGLPRLKVSSGELVNAQLLWHYGRTGLPLVLSTGMATLSEVEAGLAVLAHAVSHETPPSGEADCWAAWSDPEVRARLKASVTLLHCTSNYPTPMNEVNLRSMDTLRAAFGFDTGYSDHTQGIMIPVAAVARGACVIEKHFTLDRGLPGPDHAASLEPDELREMVYQIRQIEVALGDPIKTPQLSEISTMVAARQQIVAACRISAGDKLTEQNLTTSRCGKGIPASEFWDMIGTTALRDFELSEPITR